MNLTEYKKCLVSIDSAHIKTIKKIFFIVIAFCMLQAPVFAQQKTVTGVVSGANNQPLPGVSVLIKNKQGGTATDNEGRFSIAALSSDVLVFRSIGYTDQEISVGDKTSITVTLTATTADTTLGDVVVIGYQTVRKRDLTGATALVSMQNSSSVSAASVGESIQGLVPGVTVRNGGAPGQNSTIEIRGVASFSNADPLYVIDGMIADANSTINSNDIATIQVLKDASAAAIYGSRAANGVIIITTKRGKSGPSRISFSARYGIQQIPKKWDVMDAPAYLQMVKAQYENSNSALPSGIAAQLASPTVNTDWQDAIYQTGNTQDYNISVSGGSEHGNYLMSGSYYKNQGVLISNNFERASLRINTEARKGRLTIGENMVLSNSDGKNPGGGINAFYEAPTSVPIIAVQDPAYANATTNPQGWGFGSNEIPTYANNYVAVAALDRINYNYSKVVGNGYLDFKFTNWLSYRFNAGVEASFDYSREIRDSGIWRYANQLAATSVNESRSTFTNFLLEHTLNFNKTFNQHSINGVVGYSYQQQKRQYTSGGRINLNTINGQTFTTISSALGAPSAGSGIDLFYRIQGYLGRVNYTYGDRYLVTLSGRIDQDSRFGSAYRTGNFYSAAGSWRISKENFFNVDWISDLKIRASYGQLGISNALQTLGGSWPTEGYINNGPRSVYGTGQSPYIGSYQANINNPNLKWEQRNETNIGIDAALLNNRIQVTAELYNNLSKDVLVDIPVEYYLGTAVASTIANAASIRNKGIEISVTYTNHNNAFKWDASINGTTIDNNVESVGNQGKGINYVDVPDITFVRSQVGHPMSSWFMLKTNGLFQSQEEIDAYVGKEGAKIQPNAKPGDVRYIDQNGDGTINNDDRQFVGSPWPKFQGGAQLNASYKQFTINLQLVGVFGYKIYNGVRRSLDNYQLVNFRKDVNPWTPTNTHTTDPRLGLAQGDPGISENNRAESDRWLENGSYFRIRNLEIGYSLSKQTLAGIGFTNARIYISGQNLLTLTKYKGLDPDVTGSGVRLRGYDNGNWPSSRILSVGLQCEF